MAAFGGLLLGFGLGVGYARRAEDKAQRELARVAGQLRSTVVPLLSEHAESLGIDPSREGGASNDPVRASISLVEALRAAEGDRMLPYTDTLEFDALDDAVKRERSRR